MAFFDSGSIKMFVLVVEDEPIILMLAVSIVEDAGYEALEARSADEAVRILETRSDVRIVFTDIEMPGSMDGLTLAQAIRGRWPPIELILTSGRTAIRDEDMPDRSRFFAKPYQPAEIAEALRQMAA
jgi:CheY-like chemotaxis protein